MHVLLIFASIDLSLSIECVKCIESPLIPASTGCNTTCTGGFCYRAEKTIHYLSDSANESTAILGCFDFPLPQLKLGCRRNFEGIVLCVCNVDHCNDQEAADIVDLPLAKNCMDGLFFEMNPNMGIIISCRSNFCINSRVAMAPDKNVDSTQQYICQNNLPLLARFDIFAGTPLYYFPAGMCVKIQSTVAYVTEICSCNDDAHNCSTSTKYPGASNLTLDTRQAGYITCTTSKYETGFENCEGQFCYILQSKHGTEYGCIVYDERFDNMQLTVGAHKLLDTKIFICNDEKMCNMRSDLGVIFEKLPVNDLYNNSSCNCVGPPPTSASNSPTVNLSLVIGIAVPIAIIVIIAIALIIFRLFKDKWPFPFGVKVDSRPTVMFVIPSKQKNK